MDLRNDYLKFKNSLKIQLLYSKHINVYEEYVSDKLDEDNSILSSFKDNDKKNYSKWTCFVWKPFIKYFKINLVTLFLSLNTTLKIALTLSVSSASTERYFSE